MAMKRGDVSSGPSITSMAGARSASAGNTIASVAESAAVSDSDEGDEKPHRAQAAQSAVVSGNKAGGADECEDDGDHSQDVKRYPRPVATHDLSNGSVEDAGCHGVASATTSPLAASVTAQARTET